MTEHSGPEPRAEICVIGAGPRGISVTERLLANARERGPSAGPLVVHLVDPLIGAGGRVWSVDQPDVLLMNTIASQVTMFTDASVTCEGPVVRGPSLYEWAQSPLTAEPPEGFPARMLAEAAGLGPDDYPTRVFYGHYLNWVLRELCTTAPAGSTVRRHRTRALRLDDEPDGSQSVTLENGTRLAGLSAVVLAQGHLDMPPGERERALGAFADAHGLRYEPPANPADQDLTGLRPGEPVALRGLGLTFFDHLTLLTSARGGVFEKGDGGQLVYRPSGREPRLYAGSRRGVPYHARGDNEKGVYGRHEPKLLTAEVIAGFRARSRRGGPPAFLAEVWPLIAREVQGVYYATLLARRGHTGAVEFARRYPTVPDTLEEALLDAYGIAPDERWSWEAVARPAAGLRFPGPGAFQDWVLGRLQGDLEEARTGNLSSPLKAALDVLRDLRNEIRLVVDHAGITGDSYREELQGWYTPLNAYLSIGPPALRTEEMIALMEAGVLTLLGPDTYARPAPSGDGFLVGSPAVTGSEVRVTTLIESRLPEVDIRRTTDPLVRHLLATGACRPYELRETTGAAYRTGGLAVTERPYHLLDAAGRAHPRRFAFGVPTETVHWVTAAGIRPGADSVILGDADAIARAALAVSAGPGHPSGSG
ncbi:FAD/NAD(P)-binding protein [Streptomyces sp. NPDC058653]|uniref:FAD/NAD(P)-binding protein n=1 Tax=Streptomyces sp. NPDC058653 TaxID=3346576 RepID=UPI00364BE54E